MDSKQFAYIHHTELPYYNHHCCLSILLITFSECPHLFASVANCSFRTSRDNFNFMFESC